MMSHKLRVSGFPIEIATLKAKIFLERLAKDANIDVNVEAVFDKVSLRYFDLYFASTGEIDTFLSNLQCFKFGGDRYDLKGHRMDPHLSSSNELNTEACACRLSDNNSPKISLENAHAWADIDEISEISCQEAIIVRGCDSEIDEDELIKYFQDPEKSGGPIRSVTLMYDGILIVFYDSGVAQRLAKDLIHIVGGKNMRVVRKKIPDIDCEKLVIKMNNKDVSTDDLKSALTNLSPTSKGPEEIRKCSTSEYHIALYVEALEQNDIKTMLHKAKALEFDEGIKISTILKTDCILIRGLPHNSSVTGLKYLLESSKFCADGATITTLDIFDNDFVLAYFSSYREVEEGFKKHNGDLNYNGKTLNLSLYYHCLFTEHEQKRNESWTEKYLQTKKEKKQVALSFLYDDQEEEIFQFVVNRQRHWKKLKNKLEDVAKLTEIRNNGKTVIKVTPTTECDIPEKAQECCKKNLEDFFSKYTLRTYDAFNLEDLEMARRANLLAELNADGLDKLENDYVINWTGKTNEILTVYGTASATEIQIKSITGHVNFATDSITLLQGKYQWLKSHEFESLRKKLSCMILCDDKTHTLKFTGPRKLISEEKLEVYQAVEYVRHHSIGEIDEYMYDLLTIKRLRPQIIEIAAAILHPCKAILTFEGDAPMIWCHEEKFQAAMKMLVDGITVDRTTFKLDASEYNAIKSVNWATEKVNIEERTSALIKNEDFGLSIVGFKTEIESTIEKVKHFFEISVCTEIVKKIPGHIEYIKRFCSELGKIDVEVTYNTFGVVIKGKKYLVQQALSTISNLCIMEDKAVYKYPGIFEYFQSLEGREFIQNLSDNEKCVISFSEDIQAAASQPGNSVSINNPQPKSTENKDCDTKNVEIMISSQVIEGDITTCQHDGIVNCIGNGFILKKGGKVCQAIFKKCGSQMQNELDKDTDVEIRVTSGGKLPAKYAIHAHFTNDPTVMEERLSKVLFTADDVQCKSLAIPAIGTGSLGNDPREIAILMSNVIRNFKPLKQLASVDVVIYDKPFLVVFQEMFQLTGRAQASSPMHSILPPPKHVTASNNLNIVVRRGDITEEKSDMIVNYLECKFSQVILKKGGAELQKKIDNDKGNEIIITSGGKLPCKKISHVAIPINADNQKSMIKEVFAKCEKECCNSLAFPAMWTGQITGEALAKSVDECLAEYTAKKSLKHLKEISVVFQDSAKCVQKQKGFSLPVLPWKLLSANRNVGPLKLRIEGGDITKVDADAIVNSVGSDFHLDDGLLSQALLREAGNGIQKELDKQSDKEIRVTSGGMLPAKKIIHVVFPQEEDKMEICIKDILYKCNESDCQSLALPALGTGTLGLANSVVGKSMKKSIMEFVQDNTTRKKLTEIMVVIYEKSRLPDFVDELTKGWDVLNKEKEDTSSLLSFFRKILSRPIKDAAPSLPSLGHANSIGARKQAGKEDSTDSTTAAVVNGCGTDSITTSVVNGPTIINVTESEIIFYFHALHKNTISTVMEKVHECVEREFGHISIVVKNLRKLELWKEDKLMKILSENLLSYCINSGKSEIILTGKKETISEAASKIQIIALEVENLIEFHSLSTYLWTYSDLNNSNWAAFDEWSSTELEKAWHSKKDGEICLIIGDKKFCFDLNFFDMMIRIRDQHSNLTYIINREVKGDLPRIWEKMSDNENYRLITLDSTTAEYKHVQEKLTKTIHKAVVHSISRVQNKTLYRRYQVEKKRVEKALPGKEVEMQLFHGTDAQTAIKIASGSGFNRGYAGDTNAAHYGKGVYFAKNASYSDQAIYARPDSNGIRTILVADVITGDYCIGVRGMRTPERLGSPEPYNSAVDNLGDPLIFVIFVDAGAYPAYIIKYK